MQNKDWKNINSIFSQPKEKKETKSVYEVEWDKIAAMSLEERRIELLSNYDPEDHEEKEQAKV